MKHQKHSGLGIASFITSTASGIILILLFVIAGAIESSTPGGVDEESAEILGFSLFALLGASLASLGLGIGGLVQKERKNIFAILGTVFAAITIFMAMLTLVIG
jgi:hypothetical protein